MHDSTSQLEHRVRDLGQQHIELLNSFTELEAKNAHDSNTLMNPTQYKTKYQAKVTAYNTVPGQTDDTPCIAANGSNVCGLDTCTVAMNGVEFGTKIHIDSIGTCTVVDRKNSRYNHEWIDINFDKDINGAKHFGVQKLTFSIL